MRRRKRKGLRGRGRAAVRGLPDPEQMPGAVSVNLCCFLMLLQSSNLWLPPSKGPTAPWGGDSGSWGAMDAAGG